MIFLKRVVFILVVQLVALVCCTIQAQTAGMEVAYLQTDRTIYIAGETVFYKLYILDAATKKISKSSKVGYFIIRASNSNPSLKIRVKIDSGMANGSIVLPDTLTSGAYQIVAFTSSMKNFGDENFFHKDIVIANRYDKELNLKLVSNDSKDSAITKLRSIEPKLSTDKTVYGIREKVKVSLNNFNSNGNMAVSVFEDPKILSTNNSIVETISETLKAPVKRKLLTGFSVENKGKILRGIVIDQTTKKSVSGATVLVSCIDSVPNLQYAITNANGMFQLLLDNYYNGKELFLTIKDMPENQRWKIEIEDEFAQSEKWSPSLISQNVHKKEFFFKSQDMVYINKSYLLNNKSTEETLSEGASVCPQLYHCPVRTVYPSEFVPLDSFPEIAVELLPLVRIIKSNGKYKAQILTVLNKMYYYFSKDPAIFLDGVYVDDINKIIGLGSDQIKKIDLLSTERIFGDLVFQGIISINSYSNEIVKTIPAIQSIRLKNDNYNTGENFEAINPNTIQNKNIPYFKQLLYWNPDLKTNGTDTLNFEFYTSDNTADFAIKIEGISDNGTPISVSKGIQVNNQINTAEK